MNYKNIAIGCDHAGFEYKEIIVNYLAEKGFLVKDFGCYSKDSVDYPDFVHPLAKAVNNNEYEFGILICGSGNGVNITANKYVNVRSALCWNEEVAALARQHNNANIIALPARFIPIESAKKMVDLFLETSFEGGRHATRVNKIKEGL